MVRRSIRKKSNWVIGISLVVYICFSIIISYLFYSDAVTFNGDMTNSKKQFFIIFSCAEVIVGIIIVILCNLLIENYYVKPLVNLSDAVSSIGYDKNNQNNNQKFKDLNISSGDEIEVLYHALQKLQMDVNDYITNVKEQAWDSEHDSMTMLSNRAKFDKRKADVYPYIDSIYIACLDVINMSIVNSELSTQAGDSIISKVGRELRRISSDTIHTYRMEEDNFVVVFCGYEEAEAVSLLTKWNERVGRLNRSTDNFDCRVVWGGSFGQNNFDIEDIYKRADAEMYCQKMIAKKEGFSVNG